MNQGGGWADGTNTMLNRTMRERSEFQPHDADAPNKSVGDSWTNRLLEAANGTGGYVILFAALTLLLGALAGQLSIPQALAIGLCSIGAALIGAIYGILVSQQQLRRMLEKVASPLAGLQAEVRNTSKSIEDRMHDLESLVHKEAINLRAAHIAGTLSDTFIATLEQKIHVPEIWIVTKDLHKDYIDGDKTAPYTDIAVRNVRHRGIKYKYFIKDGVRSKRLWSEFLLLFTNDERGLIQPIWLTEDEWNILTWSESDAVVYNPLQIKMHKARECIEMKAFLESPESDHGQWLLVLPNRATAFVEKIMRLKRTELDQSPEAAPPIGQRG